MALHGARPTMLWSLLRHTAAAGEWKLTVQGEAGWQADDVILVASTGDDESQTETRTLLASQLVPALGGGWDTEVGLDAPLAHAHHGQTEIHNGHTLELRAEVGVISRPSIKLAGVDSLEPSFRFKQWAIRTMPIPTVLTVLTVYLLCLLRRQVQDDGDDRRGYDDFRTRTIGDGIERRAAARRWVQPGQERHV